MAKIVRINNATNEITLLQDNGVRVALVVPAERIEDKHAFIKEEIVKLEEQEAKKAAIAALPPPPAKLFSPIAIVIIAIETIAIILCGCHFTGIL